MRRKIFAVAGAVGLVAHLVAGAVTAFAQNAVNADIQYEILTENAKDPIMIQVAEDGRVIWTEREGGLKVLLPNGKVKLAGRVPVSANECDDCKNPEVPGLEEGGLMGLLLAKDFTKSGKIYLYYSVKNSMDRKTKMGIWHLSTFILTDDNKLDLGSEKVLLSVPVEWEHGAHYSGNLEWMPDGTILLNTGDNIDPTTSGGYGPRDTRHAYTNGELGVQNPADRRGKILRLMPDGSVPDGSQRGIEANPFVGETIYQPYICKKDINKNAYTGFVPCDGGPRSKHMIEFDPYVYSLGYKQPWRAAVHPSGTVYVSDVGPDAFTDDPAKGPRGREELNVVPPGGGTNHGWPRCMADNIPYHDYNWKTEEDNGELDCSKMEPATIFYPHDASEQWPVFGTGLVTNVPAAFYSAKTKGPLRLPERFDNTLIDFEFSRNSIFAIPTAKDGTLDTDQTTWQVINPPSKAVVGVEAADSLAENGNMLGLMSPIDGTVAPDGAIYFIEYGQLYYNNALSRISRIKCAGCELPKGKNYGLDEAVMSSDSSSSGDGSGWFRWAELAGLAALLSAAALSGRVRRRAVA
jgi:aldose sugar dehydrogenase